MPTYFIEILLRGLLALLFITTAIGKLLDNRGFAAVLGTYQLFPSLILLPLALSISLGELWLGVQMARGRWPALLAATAVAINSAYLVLALVTLARGISLSNCGCFGVFLARPLTWMTPVEDAVLVVFSILYWWLTAHSGQRRLK